MQSIELKRGTTLSWSCAYTDESGDPVDLTGYTVTSQLRDTDGALVDELDVDVDAGSGGTFAISASASETAALGSQDYLCDVRLESAGGEVYATDTFFVRVVPQITRPA